jgi:hypothetical protein
MNSESWTAVAAAPVAVVAIIAITLTYAHDRPADNVETTRSLSKTPNGSTSSRVDAGVVAAVLPDAPCERAATPSPLPRETDAHRVEAQESNPASQAKATTEPMTEEQAIESARSISDGAQKASAEGVRDLDLAALPAAAALVPYEEAARWVAGTPDTTVVDSSRCTWAVTVHGPFVPRAHPQGMEVRPLGSYTVLFDELSGQYLGLSAGTDAGDLITGERPSKS